MQAMQCRRVEVDMNRLHRIGDCTSFAIDIGVSSTVHTLEFWLQHWTAQHPREIVMGLERVRAVWRKLGAPSVADIVITVAGTNGKGSTVAFVDSILRAGGHRVGRYSSPHILRYSERIVIAGEEVSEADICAAFARIDQARGELALTWFEAGTLAALLLFADARLDAAVLEVGLGGRLDAVNIIDADVAIITSIALDHQDILGYGLAAIAHEKAGIARAGKPVIVAQPDPEPALLDALQQISASVLRAEVDYFVDHDVAAGHWQLRSAQATLRLPMPPLPAPIQLRNAAAAIFAVLQCARRLPMGDDDIGDGLSRTRLPGRLQQISMGPDVFVDVAHNPEAATALRAWLGMHPYPTRAVFSALADKDAVGIIGVLADVITHWHVCGLQAETPRGASAEQVYAQLREAFPTLSMTAHDAPPSALAAARAQARSSERILVFGSFHLIAAVSAGD